MAAGAEVADSAGLTTRSDVVCFESRGPAVAGGPHRSLVSVGGDGYHLPPGARLRLHSVQQRFKAYGTSARHLCGKESSPLAAPQPGSLGLLEPARPAGTSWVLGCSARFPLQRRA